jgi:hypothetical protein
VYLKRAKVIMAAGAHKIARGIHRGLVKIIRISTQKHRPINKYRRLDCRKISRMTIKENKRHLSKNFAVFLALNSSLIRN